MERLHGHDSLTTSLTARVRRPVEVYEACMVVAELFPPDVGELRPELDRDPSRLDAA